MKRFMLAYLLILITTASAEETTLDMVLANNKKVKELSAKLDKALTTFKKTLDQEGKGLLDKEQSAWLAYMNARVAFSADKYRGGSFAKVEAGGAMIREYKARIKDIEGYIKNYNEP